MEKVLREKPEPIRIVSLFDGCGSLRHSLELLGIPDEFIQLKRSEINGFSNLVFDTHYEAENLGDVRLIKGADLNFDGQPPHLVVSSSPCLTLTSMSFNSHLQLAGSESSLFYQYIRILNEVRNLYPNHTIDHLQENVASMKANTKLEFSTLLNCSALRHDSQFDSPCRRSRYYWSSFSLKDFYKHPIEKKTLKDILENGYTDTPNDIGMCILSNDPSTALSAKGLERSLTKRIGTPIFVSQDYVGKSTKDKIELFHERKSETRYVPEDGSPIFKNGQFRFMSCLEKERALGFEDNYTNCNISNSQRAKMLGKTFNCNSIMRILLCHPKIQEILKYVNDEKAN